MLDRPPAWTEEKSASPDRAGGAMAMVLSAKADANDGVRILDLLLRRHFLSCTDKKCSSLDEKLIMVFLRYCRNT